MIKRTLYFGNPAYLSVKQKQLIVRIPGIDESKLSEVLKDEVIRSIPISDIGIVVLDHRQITITSCVLEELLSNQVAVITCDSKSMPSGLLLPLNGNSIQNERFREQISASVPLLKSLWQQTVQSKILNQAGILKEFTGQKAENMVKWAAAVCSGDSRNLEARAAAFYWKNVFPEIHGFVRGRDENPPNNLLNYGYAILRAIVARSLVCSGLLPTLGIHHHNRYNAYCLADDIMEPYRPYVDRIVIKTVHSGIDYSILDKELKKNFLGIPTLDVMIDGKSSPLMVAVNTTTASLYKCFNKISRKIIYPQI